MPGHVSLTLTWKRLSALTAALSSLMYWPRSSVDRLKELKLDSSDSSSRKRTTAAKHDMATCQRNHREIFYGHVKISNCHGSITPGYQVYGKFITIIIFFFKDSSRLGKSAEFVLCRFWDSDTWEKTFQRLRPISEPLTCLSSSGSVLLATVSPLLDLSSLLRSCTMSLLLNSALFRSDTSTPPRCTTYKQTVAEGCRTIIKTNLIHWESLKIHFHPMYSVSLRIIIFNCEWSLRLIFRGHMKITGKSDVV